MQRKKHQYHIIKIYPIKSEYIGKNQSKSIYIKKGGYRFESLRIFDIIRTAAK
jgi:hypothetical protein